MTIEEKQLLLKDLCGRLPYGIKCQYLGVGCDAETFEDVPETTDDTIVFIEPDIYNVFLYEEGTDVDIEDIRPYLRPMSSMTEEERKEYNEVIAGMTLFEKEEARVCPYLMPVVWLLKKHFDVCGLLPKDLAVEAPVGMYKTE